MPSSSISEATYRSVRGLLAALAAFFLIVAGIMVVLSEKLGAVINTYEARAAMIHPSAPVVSLTSAEIGAISVAAAAVIWLLIAGGLVDFILGGAGVSDEMRNRFGESVMTSFWHFLSYPAVIVLVVFLATVADLVGH